MPDTAKPEQPTLSQAFNQRGVSKYADNVAAVSSALGQFFVDFAMRVVYHSGTGVIPFAQFDREVLAEIHDRFTQLGNNPPPLPDEKPATPLPKPRALNP